MSGVSLGYFWSTSPFDIFLTTINSRYTSTSVVTFSLLHLKIMLVFHCSCRHPSDSFYPGHWCCLHILYFSGTYNRYLFSSGFRVVSFRTRTNSKTGAKCNQRLLVSYSCIKTTADYILEVCYKIKKIAEQEIKMIQECWPSSVDWNT